MSSVSNATSEDATARSRTTRRPRGGTSRDEVVAAALDLVDSEGLDALTVRRLAAELDMEPMSLYKRVANKDDLVTGVAELIWNEVAAAAVPTDDWAGWLHALGTAVRDAVRQHPNALPLLVAGEVFPSPLLEVIATQLEREGPGWPDRRDAANAICTVTAFALGCAVAECSYCTPTTSDDPAVAERQRLRRIARALPADTPDRLIDTALDVCGTDAGDMFTNGLALVIRGTRQP